VLSLFITPGYKSLSADNYFSMSYWVVSNREKESKTTRGIKEHVLKARRIKNTEE
jgi:hypothetical protein